MSKQKNLNNLTEKSEESNDLLDLPENQKQLALILERFYAGPLPHPTILKQFEEFIPGSADRILKIFEEQTTHRQYLEKSREEHNQFIEKKNLENNHKQITTGQFLGFFICLAALTSGTICALLGAVIPGSLFGTAGVAGLAAVFIYGSKKKSQTTKAA